ncbi:MAG TPA: alpha-amylase family glycosyl hydrolase [Labilithrix sp.]|nr:alpha-amylase family glycosyl hydrolase [Labilithrix sp.]
MHARKTARDALFPSKEDDVFFAPRRGDIVFPDGAAVRRFADRVNRLEGRPPHAELRPAELAAMALVHEVFHAVVSMYRERHPASFRRLAAALESSLGPAANDLLVAFLGTFPPPRVYRALHGEGDDTPRKYLERSGPTAEAEIDEELILLWVTNQNPAYDGVRRIITDHELGASYQAFVAETLRFFYAEPAFGPGGETLVELLLAPGRAHPTSIVAQLEYIERRWGRSLGLERLPLWRRFAWLRDFRAEEGKWFEKGGPGPGQPLLDAMQLGRREDAEPAQFSPDLNWMPNVVLIAKSVYVWLDQLSKKYGRSIVRLDQIPDEELDLLAARGMNGLWLIGLFERSPASRKVKQMRGDHDALASAYSLKSYVIAHELGGAPAYESLKARAWARGIRLAADMVPNHVGIDGDWVIEHPDWFLQTRTPPFPSYRFGGPDLSEDPRVGIFLEEGYWNKTDAAVVFRRHDRWTGEDRFIYHGNDGTSMPWNDTAQLDYLNADVRRAVIDTIVHVARMFPIIRFDAAMTLAKRHIQRLWYPLPGQGGAIPSRADYAMTQEEFDRRIPVEFWREVVDAVAERAPDTLLLAEAFWMMEGYFVRTLGMHRVYNSAFMNMLKREENAKYRATIKNVLDFDAEVLKRFVNFMNNPDEETAIAQFGDDDKYFGVCVLMSTMPGLPMFGHGQIEGLHEKYGMEYRRARHDEPANEHLVRRHEREIFPLLHQRYLYSGVDNFALYDFVTEGGAVDEDVYAYSNGVGAERTLVLFNNKWKTTTGRVYRSTHRANVAEELRIDPSRGEWLVIRDVTHGLEFLRPAYEVCESGLVWELPAFRYHVLAGFRPVTATRERPYDRLAAELAGRGVADVERAVRELYLRPVHAPLREACSKGHIAYLTSQLDEEDITGALAALEQRLGHVADGLDWLLSQRAHREVAVDRGPIMRSARARYEALHAIVQQAKAPEPIAERDTAKDVDALAEAGAGTTIGDGADGTVVQNANAPTAVNDAPAGAPVGDASVLHVDLLLASIQVEAVVELLALAERAVDVKKARAQTKIRGKESSPPAAEEAAAGDAAASDTASEVDVAPATAPRAEVGAEADASAAEAPKAPSVAPSAWAEREALVATWELANPLVSAFETAHDTDEANRRAALVLLSVTLPSGSVADAMRHALVAPRGQTFMDVHVSEGTTWLNKERFEELARALAEREVTSGRVTQPAASAEVEMLAVLAADEGYRVDRISAKLGRATAEQTPRSPATTSAPLSYRGR